MPDKMLSTGTLSLRFMQNANRAKNQKEVELERAEVKDDGQWEVAQEIRDAWGMPSGVASTESVAYEMSYLPFLFSTDPESPAVNEEMNRPKGRRVFNKQGVEITEEASEPTISIPSTSTPPSKGSKIHPRPISISLSGSSGHLRGFEQLKKPGISKSAKQAIFESGGVGTDLRHAASIELTPVTELSTPDHFLKPAGVHDPLKTESSPPRTGIKDKAADSVHKRTVKREREGTFDHLEAGKNRKRKKKKSE